MKRVLIFRGALERAALLHGVVLGRDVRIAEGADGRLAVQGHTLAGQLFLSLLVQGV